VAKLLALISDLFFSTQAQSAARALGWEVLLVENAAQVPSQPPLIGRPDVPASSQNGELGHNLVAWVVELAPALILVELASQSLPWEDWIIALKTSPATLRTPVLGFGPHVDARLRERALAAGCDAVITQGQFSNRLAALLQQYARQPDPAAAQAVAEGALSPQARQGLILFNREEYFEAHEELEHAWNAETGPARDLYQGVLQVAVAYLHITRHNYNGAVKMFLRARQWLDPLPDICRGVDVAALRREAASARAALEALGPGRIAEFDSALLKPIRVVDDAGIQGPQDAATP
jgi:predicted metal-dependent hydrolase